MENEIWPVLSIIIAAHNGKTELNSCLAALKNQFFPDEPVNKYEIIVVGYLHDARKKSISKKYPEVKILQVATPLSVPALRSIGIKASKGDIIALLEDHCFPANDWIQTILSNHQKGYQVVGGAVENSLVERSIDWAVYFFEYSAFMNPISEGTTTSLPGNNVSYRRSAMKYFEDLLDQNLWEFFWHKRLMKNEVLLYSTPDMIVYHNRPFHIMRFWHLSFIHGCNHAVTGLSHSNLQKLLWVISTVFIPAILTFRISSRILRKQRYLKEFIKASPIILWFYIGWTAGEFMGTLTGRVISETGWGE